MKDTNNIKVGDKVRSHYIGGTTIGEVVKIFKTCVRVKTLNNRQDRPDKVGEIKSLNLYHLELLTPEEEKQSYYQYQLGNKTWYQHEMDINLV